MPPLAITQAQLDQIEQSLLGRVNLRPRSITEDKLAVGAASAAIVREGSISNVHIGTLSVDVLTGGTISGQTIIVASGGTIQSANYSAGTDGWAIFADGSAEFNDVTVRGNLLAGTININGQFIVDATGNVIANDITATGVLTAQAGSNLPGDYISDGDLSAVLDLTTDGSISGNYSTGVSGWAIDGNGNAEFNDVVIRGLYASELSGRRIEIESGFTNFIRFYSGDAGEESPGYLALVDTGTRERLQLRSPVLDSVFNLFAYVDLYSGQTGNPSELRMGSVGDVSIDSSSDVLVTTGGTSIMGVTAASFRLTRAAGGAGSGTNVQFYDSTGTRLGYAGFAADDDLRIWNESAAGTIFLATDDTLRFSIASTGAIILGNSTTPGAITHSIYNDRPSNPNLLVVNRAPVGGANNAHGIDIYLGSSGSPAINTDTGDAYMRFRRPDGTVLGQIRGNGGGTDFVTTSDRKLKEDISDDVSIGAAAFDEIPWRSFTWKNTGRPGFGVVAQQLAKVPTWAHSVAQGGVTTDEDPDTGKKRKFYAQWGVDYVPFIGAIGAKLVDVDRRLRALEER